MKEGVPFITQIDLLFMKINLSVNGRKKFEKLFEILTANSCPLK